MKKIVAFFLVCILFLMSGCIVDKRVEGYSQHRIIVTPRGMEVILPNEVESYAVLNESYTETLVDLGFENQMVVVNKESLYLGQFRNVQNVFNIKEPDIQGLISAEPDIVIVDDETLKLLNDVDKATLNNSGIPLIILDAPKSVAEVKTELEFLVGLTDAQYGEQMIADFNEKLNHIQKLQQERNTYLLGYMQLAENNSEVTTVGGGTFLSDALKEAGVMSIFEDKTGIVSVTKEEVASRNPQTIIIVSNDESSGTNINNNPLFENVEAIKSGNVVILDKFDLMNPNYKCVDWILSVENKVYN